MKATALHPAFSYAGALSDSSAKVNGLFIFYITDPLSLLQKEGVPVKRQEGNHENRDLIILWVDKGY